MNKVPFEQAVHDAVRQNPRYSADAYHFLRDALDVTIKTMQKGRKDAINHVSGPELCEGVREYALQQFGPMVPTSVTTDPSVVPLRELVYLPKGVVDPHGVPESAPRVGRLPEQVLETLPKATAAGSSDSAAGSNAQEQV